MTDIASALAAVAKRLGANDTAPIHVNDGQNEEYVSGFNDGYDDAEGGLPCQPPGDGRWAYVRGYYAGWDWVRNESTD